jgi:cytochrome c biogenesis protein CcmG, thiol:disulfide interchange protein DsbE
LTDSTQLPWCVPCRKEHQELNVFASRVSPEDVQLIAVTFDSGIGDVSSFLDQYGRAITIALDPDGVAAIEFGVVGVPETFVVDERGVVRRHFIGPTTATELTTVVNELNSIRSEVAPQP